MNENLPFISIIITCFNSKKTILETIDSIVNQTYQYWECIIVDDKSTDNSQEIIRDYIKDDERFLFIEMQSNNGKSFNLNYALSITRAEIILIVDSDDILSKECINNRLKKIQRDLDFYVFPNYHKFDDDIENAKSDHRLLPSNYLRNFIIHKLPTPWQETGVLWKKEAILKIGGYNENLSRIIDVDIASRALIFGLKYEVFHELEADYYYRLTSDEKNIKSKRNKFFIASMTFIEEIRLFTQQNSPEKLKEVEKYLYHFFLSVLAMTLVSPQFDEKDSLKLIECAKENQLIRSKGWGIFSKSITHKLTKLPIIRTLIWRGTNMYIKK